MERNAIPLDMYDVMPSEQRVYYMNYGKHFNKKMCEFAVKQMRDRNNQRVEMTSKEDLEKKLKDNGIEIKNNILHDAVYVYAMAHADFMGSSIEDDKHLLLYVKDLLDDTDAADGQVFNRFYADCMNAGVPIDWSEML